ncbi:glycosyltransferase family 2 protein [Marinihelvus fidelis]|uniref:Glycosyltransferase family 2 protein n=1 Tax=Marinihelvus fidelis TaxID=2613842 RepID=A0A5N0THL4_9GAMM|nr:glycosyltransferase [Marinihelvus fidelis]KAA9134081.1 glycosyltransferase family 2 protein [Marinihelvus fidelis]
MAAPYATVLLPTHERHQTLALALASARAQTVENIEILVACDGATGDVREVAASAARDDARIQVLDLPKGHNNGGVARAKALERARSDRILVLQDDDLWFPEHVETLAPMLDRHDVVTAATLAVRPSGSVCAWVSNYADPGYRKLALEAGLKLVFEAHYAFSHRSYQRRGVAWERVEKRGNIKRLLDAHLADPSVRWGSTSEATALSFNSPVFEQLPGSGWAEALAHWLGKMQQGLKAETVLREAHWGPTLWYATRRVLPEPDDTLDAYLARCGLDGSGAKTERSLQLYLSADQRKDLEQCFSLCKHGRLSTGISMDMALDLAEPFAGPLPLNWPKLFCSVSDASWVDSLTDQKLGAIDSGRRGILLAIAAYKAFTAGDVRAGKEYLRRAREQTRLHEPIFQAVAARMPRPGHSALDKMGGE